MIIQVNVAPSSPGFRLENKDGRLKAYLKSPAERNKANIELIKELSALLGVPVRLVCGSTSRRKKLDIPLDEKEWARFLSSLGKGPG